MQGAVRAVDAAPRNARRHGPKLLELRLRKQAVCDQDLTRRSGLVSVVVVVAGQQAG